jgi:RNA polymerase sigma factor (TIGR02999 family)
MPGGNLTELIQRAGRGDRDAADELFAATYPELRRMAHARLRGASPGAAVLDTGSLVHESYLRFAASGQLRVEDRVHFLHWAGRVMRSVIVDLVRNHRAERRGGDAPHVALTTQLGVSGRDEGDEILYVHEAIDMLGAADPRLAQVVEMRYFGGLSESEIAEALDVTERTVRRDWNKARLFLRDTLK